MKHLRFSVCLLFVLSFIVSEAKIKPEVFSSSSTVCRELEMEKLQEHKDKIKALKKQFRDLKDFAIERWSDGKVYYILYSKHDGEFTIMPLDADTPYFMWANDEYLAAYSNIEIIEHEGYKFFKVRDDLWLFYNGKNTSKFNPTTEIKQYGSSKYVVKVDVYGDRTTYFVYSLDGTNIMQSGSLDFYPAEEAGVRYDKNTGLALYHPAMPERFVGVNETAHLAEYGKPRIYYLGYFGVPDTHFSVRVPGGDYFVGASFPLPSEIKTEVRQGVDGKMYKYKVFEVAERFYTSRDMQLYVHAGRHGRPILPDKANRLKISTPDQIAYYSYYDGDARFDRMGCISLVDSTFRIPPKFADIKVFYDSENKPFAMVKMSSLAEYEIYDPAKTYDYMSMSDLELNFERKAWPKVISAVKTKTLEELPEKNLYPWLYAEIEMLKNDIDVKNEALKRLRTHSLADGEEAEIMNRVNSAGNQYSWYNPIRFSSDYSVDDAVIHFAENIQSPNAEKYKLMADYLNSLIKQRTQLAETIEEAEKTYVQEKRMAQIRQDAERQQRILEAEQQRQANSAMQQAIMLSVLGSIFNAVSGGSAVLPQTNYIGSAMTTTAVPQGYVNTSGTTAVQPVNIYSSGREMLEATSVSPEIEGMAIANGWVPETASSASDNSSSSGSNLCHACFGSGKCGVCNGSGRYMPNLDGHYIDCTACKKSGECAQCGGQGHH